MSGAEPRSRLNSGVRRGKVEEEVVEGWIAAMQRGRVPFRRHGPTTWPPALPTRGSAESLLVGRDGQNQALRITTGVPHAKDDQTAFSGPVEHHVVSPWKLSKVAFGLDPLGPRAHPRILLESLHRRQYPLHHRSRPGPGPHPEVLVDRVQVVLGHRRPHGRLPSARARMTGAHSPSRSMRSRIRRTTCSWATTCPRSTASSASAIAARSALA